MAAAAHIPSRPLSSFVLDAARARHDSAAFAITAHSATAACSFAAWRNLLMTVWRAPPSAECVSAFESALLAISERCGCVSLLHVVEAGAALPTPQIRAEILAMVKRRAHLIRCSAHVLEGGGFARVAIRASLAGFYLRIKKPYPAKVFDGPEPAAYWLAPQLTPNSEPPVSRHDIVRRVAALRVEGHQAA